MRSVVLGCAACKDLLVMLLLASLAVPQAAGIDTNGSSCGNRNFHFRLAKPWFGALLELAIDSYFAMVCNLRRIFVLFSRCKTCLLIRALTWSVLESESLLALRTHFACARIEFLRAKIHARELIVPPLVCPRAHACARLLSRAEFNNNLGEVCAGESGDVL